MTLREAFRVFGLAEDATIRDLNRAFRVLVKKYHPDVNRERLDWAHRAMTLVNVAYTTCRESLDRPASNQKPRAKGPPHDGRGRNGTSTTAHGTAAASAPEPGSSGAEESARMRAHTARRLRDELLDLVYLYYQYGLENVHLRYEGVRRYRYRSVRRRLHNLRTTLLGHRDQTTNTIAEFAAAFDKHTSIETFGMPSDPPPDRVAYRYLLEGTRSLDILIKRGFFEEFRRDKRIPPMPNSAELAAQNFLTVLTKYRGSRWTTEATVRLRLLDATVALLTLIDTTAA